MAIDSIKVLAEREGESKVVRNNLLLEVEAKQYRVEIMCYLSSARMTMDAILDALPAPYRAGDPYPSNAAATCVNRVAVRTNNRKMWIVKLVYDTERVTQLLTDDPLNQPPEVYFGTFKYAAPMVYDQLGVPVITSAGHRFDPVPSYEFERTLVTITRNVPQFPMARKRRFNLKLNLLPFLGFPKFTGRINELAGRRMLSSGRVFWQETIELEFRTYPDSFFDYYLDADFRDITGQMFFDPFTKAMYTNPTLLNGKGKDAEKVTPHSLLANLTADTKTYDVSGSPDVMRSYPPPPAAVLPNGMQPGPYNTEFTIEIRSNTDKTKFEIIKVVGGIDTGVWVLNRKLLGSTQTAWTAGQATVKLLAYYMKYVPYLAVDWTPLQLDNLELE